MVSGTAKPKNGDAPEQTIFVICENDILRSGNLGMKMGVSRAEHIPNMHMEVRPPPPESVLASVCTETKIGVFKK